MDSDSRRLKHTVSGYWGESNMNFSCVGINTYNCIESLLNHAVLAINILLYFNIIIPGGKTLRHFSVSGIGHHLVSLPICYHRVTSFITLFKIEAYIKLFNL